MDRSSRDRAVESALVHRRPGTSRGIVLCFLLALAGVVLVLLSHGTHGIGIALIALGLVTGISGMLHIGWSTGRRRQ
jgi:hypothetical protein